jgi:hypothetical protein
MLLIPFVQWKNDGTKFHNYVVRMYLTWQAGVDLGNLNAGLRKELADISFLIPLPDVSLKVAKDGTEMFHAQANGQSGWMNESTASTALTNFNEMKAIFQMPILGKYPYDVPISVMTPHDGYVCSYFVWDFSDPTTQIRSVKSTFQFVANFVSGMDQWVALGSLANEPNGAFGVDQLKWLVTFSQPCKF